MQISKSDYMLFLKHPAWLWLHKHDQGKLHTMDENTLAMLDDGKLFETYAEKLFPGGLRLGFTDYDEYLDLPTRTQKALQDGVKTIFQGRFEHSQLTFICDVIQVVDGNIVDLFEIKSSTKVKPDHILDLSFQMVVLELCGYTVRNISVIHVNNQYIRQGDIAADEFAILADVTDFVKAKRDLTKENIKKALEVASSLSMPDPSPSLATQSALKEWHGIYRNLVTVGPESIYDLCVPSAKNIGRLEALKIKNLIDIPPDFKLNDKQKYQIQSTKQNKVILSKDKIIDFMSTLKYPLYFLDYETLGSTVPYFDGMRSYQQLPFQYSLHVLDGPGAELKHFEYLHCDNSNPVEVVSQNLASQIGTSGSVITWNAGFEKGCNTLMGSLLPEYEKFYRDVNSRIVDLMMPFFNSWYVHKNFGGSASIKAVLPVLAPELSYKALGIQEGGSAQRLWMEAILYGKRESEKEQILADLIKYCGLDTLAMVAIYRHLMDVVSVN